jgi:hypothetical protein
MYPVVLYWVFLLLCTLPLLSYVHMNQHPYLLLVNVVMTALWLCRLLWNAGFFSPLLLVVCWIVPMTTKFVTPTPADALDRTIEAKFDSIRLGLFVASALVRLAGMRLYMQAFLRCVLSVMKHLP